MLKVVNSAFYGLPGQIGSIERAIVLLGLNAVKNIAVAASLGQLFRGARLAGGFTAKDLWTHCVAVAVTARDLATQHQLPIGEEAFLAGMIHDIGILISLQTSPEALREVCERGLVAGKEPLQASSGAGSLLRYRTGRGWNRPSATGEGPGAALEIPCRVSDCGRHHHDPLSASAEHRSVVGLVWAADTICCRAGHGFNPTALRQQLDPQTVRALDLDPALLRAAPSRIDELLTSAQTLTA